MTGDDARMAGPPVHLGAIGHVLGEARPVAELAGRIPADRLSHMLENGLEHYRLSDHAPWELAVEAALASRAAAGDAIAGIDGVVYVTNSFPRPGLGRLRAVAVPGGGRAVADRPGRRRIERLRQSGRGAAHRGRLDRRRRKRRP